MSISRLKIINNEEQTKSNFSLRIYGKVKIFTLKQFMDTFKSIWAQIGEI